jgi:phosphoribosylformimino-5-aminoimidazole carboxamide ribotide isomerase
MYVIPAIDMKEGRVVRLKQGRMTEATVYPLSIEEQAQEWIIQGAKRLHLVDLNGAFEGQPRHFDVIAAVARQNPHIALEVGGGIRDLATIQKYDDHGVQFFILGTAAVKNPLLIEEACAVFPGRIILGVDARAGFVATEGWAAASREAALEVIEKFSGCALESVIYTDIGQDGMLSGINLIETQKIMACGLPVIASGGLSSLDDIHRLKEMGAYGVIAGKVLYEGKINLVDMIKIS